LQINDENTCVCDALSAKNSAMDFTKLQNLLDEQVNWPEHYQFKFVVKSEKKMQVLELLDEHHVSEKLSRNGKYTSITSKKLLHSSDEVIQVYEKMSKIEGVISL
tara:strand:- start:3733 stop:4047 length:315 start_codon:yes stop_codon:yes gene_type:complete